MDLMMSGRRWWTRIILPDRSSSVRVYSLDVHFHVMRTAKHWSTVEQKLIIYVIWRLRLRIAAVHLASPHIPNSLSTFCAAPMMTWLSPSSIREEQQKNNNIYHTYKSYTHATRLLYSLVVVKKKCVMWWCECVHRASPAPWLVFCLAAEWMRFGPGGLRPSRIGNANRKSIRGNGKYRSNDVPSFSSQAITTECMFEMIRQAFGPGQDTNFVLVTASPLCV